MACWAILEHYRSEELQHLRHDWNATVRGEPLPEMRPRMGDFALEY